jgi:putative glutamine amidotransferase
VSDGARSSNDRPVVGITTYEERARWADWDLPAALLPASYVRAVEAAGAIPLLVPAQELSADDARRLVDRLDGLVLAGGHDVDPDRYGAARHPETTPPTERRRCRDACELALVGAVSSRPTPTLAICRGIQVLNVARGGSLLQHLPDAGDATHDGVPGGFGSHPVRLEAGSVLARAFDRDAIEVPTRHHQAIDPAGLGRGLTPVAWAEDGTIEAVEDRSLPFLLGVQWHPEAGDDPSLFDALVEAARRALRASRTA